MNTYSMLYCYYRSHDSTNTPGAKELRRKSEINSELLTVYYFFYLFFFTRPVIMLQTATYTHADTQSYKKTRNTNTHQTHTH